MYGRAGWGGVPLESARAVTTPSQPPLPSQGEGQDHSRSSALASRAARNSESVLQFGQRRSEEHTSELQSLMRISYAVFCLKKKNIHSNDITYELHNPYLSI